MKTTRRNFTPTRQYVEGNYELVFRDGREEKTFLKQTEVRVISDNMRLFGIVKWNLLEEQPTDKVCFGDRTMSVAVCGN